MRGSQTQCGGRKQAAAFRPDVLETLPPGFCIRRIVKDQRGARLRLLVTHDGMGTIGDEQYVAQTFQIGIHAQDLKMLPVIFEERKQTGMLAGKVIRAPQGNAKICRGMALQEGGKRLEPRRCFQMQLGQIVIPDTKLDANARQNRADIGVELAPGIMDFSGHVYSLVECRPFGENKMPIGRVETLDHEARGIARQEGKAIFIEGALPGERVEYASYRKKPQYEQAHLIRILEPSVLRVAPRCPHFGICGGCAMQHLDAAAQVAVKQRVLEDNLWHIGRVRPEHLLPPIQGTPWGYRHKARLGVRKVPKKGGMLIGFHEKRSSYIADIQSCAVLHPAVSRLLLPLRELIGALSIAERLPQIEVAVGDACVALVLRILEPLTESDETRLRAFADTHGIVFYLQPKGPETACRFHPLPGAELEYRLPEYELTMPFRPTDFTQVNHGINRVLIRHALKLLDPQPGEKIADLFCGLGNFSLPIARCGASVVGVEGNPALVERAQGCAQLNHLDTQTRFIAANLFECTPESLAALGPQKKFLIDPPREGAVEVVKALPDATMQGEYHAPERIVYVSCNPATLARDAAILTHLKGYRFVAAGAINMFPHTAHVESIALFERPQGLC